MLWPFSIWMYITTSLNFRLVCRFHRIICKCLQILLCNAFAIFDDFVIGHLDRDTLSRVLPEVRTYLCRAKVLINCKKSMFDPFRKIAVLGAIFNTIMNEVTLSDERKAIIDRFFQILIEASHLRKLTLQRFSDHLAYVLPFIKSPWVLLHPLYLAIETNDLRHEAIRRARRVDEEFKMYIFTVCFWYAWYHLCRCYPTLSTAFSWRLLCFSTFVKIITHLSCWFYGYFIFLLSCFVFRSFSISYIFRQPSCHLYLSLSVRLYFAFVLFVVLCCCSCWSHFWKTVVIAKYDVEEAIGTRIVLHIRYSVKILRLGL